MRKIAFFLILIFCLLSIIHSLGAIVSLWKKKDLIVQAQKQLLQAQKQNTFLHKQLTVVQDQSFIEEEARNKLFMTKPGEHTVIIPKDLIVSTEKQPVHVNSTQAYWQQWLSLFFY